MQHQVAFVSLTNSEHESTYILLIVMGRLKAGLSKCRVRFFSLTNGENMNAYILLIVMGAIESGIE